jgi:hypothetical protein
LALILYINGQLADLDAGQVISQTKQVNDLNSLENRQANYTNKFNLPKTANNVRIMNFLTVPGNQSDIPYTQNSCSLYSETGECFVYNGWAVVTDGGDSYEAVVYDGIIDLYKKIENTTLGLLELEDLTHNKTPATVKASFTSDDSLPYRYILADYNGKTGSTNSVMPIVETDYLVPSVNVAWLWHKIFEKYDMQYSGAVFKTENFKNLWMTYPKGISSSEGETEVLNINTYSFPKSGIVKYEAYYFKTAKTDTYDPTVISIAPTTHIKVSQAGRYRIEIEGTINASYSPMVLLGKNGEQMNAANVPIVHNFGLAIDKKPFKFSYGIDLEAQDSICVILKRRDRDRSFRLEGEKDTASIKLTKLSVNNFSFSTAFTDFSTRDFMTEVVNRFGLTLYKDKYTNMYRFLTLQEQLQSAVINWSGKFSKAVSQNYIYGSYAQRNWFKYTYNDKEATHNDGFLDVANLNLPDSKDVVKSKIYSPEKNFVKYLNGQGNVYKLWDKEAVDNPEDGEDPVTYKPLDKRYYFLRANVINQPVTLKSTAGVSQISSPVALVESYYKMKFGDVMHDYYSALKSILSKSLVVTAELWLTDNDVINFDFSKLYYIEQLSGYYIMNKINNYVPGKITKCELVHVPYSTIGLDFEPKTITLGTFTRYNQRFMSIPYSANYDTGTLVVQSSVNQVIWTDMRPAAASPVVVQVGGLKGTTIYLRINDIDNSIQSSLITMLL